jgi:hypothetical protein
MPIRPIWPNYEVNGLDWQCCLAGSSKRAPRVLIFSIFLGAKYLCYVKFTATRAPTFFGYIFLVLASVWEDVLVNWCFWGVFNGETQILN